MRTGSISETDFAQLLSLFEDDRSPDERLLYKNALEALHAGDAPADPADGWDDLRRGLDLASWSLTEELCDESRRLAADDPARALDVAEAAEACAEALCDTQRVLDPQGSADSAGPLFELRLLTLAHRANALRNLDRLDEARKLFEDVERRQAQGPCALPRLRAQVLSLRASLELDQRRFEAAAHCLALAFEHGQRQADSPAWSRLEPRLYLQQALVLAYQGLAEEAVEVLERLLPDLDPERDPDLWLRARHNYLDHLSRLERFDEVAAGLPEVQRLVNRHGGWLDLRRVDWLEARLCAAQGDAEGAVRRFEAVRTGFLERGMYYKAAVVTLEQVTVAFGQGDWSEVRRVTAALAPIFAAEKIHQEALIALALFQQAVLAQTLSAELLCRLGSYLNAAEHRPELRFEST